MNVINLKCIIIVPTYHPYYSYSNTSLLLSNCSCKMPYLFMFNNDGLDYNTKSRHYNAKTLTHFHSWIKPRLFYGKWGTICIYNAFRRHVCESHFISKKEYLTLKRSYIIYTMQYKFMWSACYFWLLI